MSVILKILQLITDAINNMKQLTAANEMKTDMQRYFFHWYGDYCKRT